MRTRNGFSLVEMMIALIATAIMALAFSAFGSIGLDYFNRSRRESAIFDDMVYALRTVQNEVRKTSVAVSLSTSCPPNPAGSSWIPPCLNVNPSGAFGVLCMNSNVTSCTTNPGSSSVQRRFVYSFSGTPKILSRMTTQGNSLAFSVPILAANRVRVGLSWKMNNIFPYNPVNNVDYAIYNDVTRRIQ